jgi:tetratricopeptide (TPR) repeat protein
VERAPRGFLEGAGEAYLVVGLCALVVQLVQVRLLARDPSVSGPIIDGREYHLEAARIVAHGAAPEAPHWQSPLFPWLLSGVYRLTGADAPDGLFLNAALGVLIALEVLALARLALPPRTAALAAFAAVLYGPLLFFSSQLIGAPLDAATALGALLLACVIPVEAPPWKHCLTGTALGVAMASRGTVAPFLLVLVARPYLTLARSGAPSGRRDGALRGVAAALGALLGLLPVALSNHARTGRWSLSTSNLGVNFYLGNHWAWREATRVRPGWRWEALLAEPARAGVTDPTEASRWFLDRAFAWMAHHPYAAARGFVLKLLDVFNGFEIPRNLDPYGSLGRTKLTAVFLWHKGLRFPFGLVLPLAVLGLWWLTQPREGRPRAPWVGRTVGYFVALNAVGVALFFPAGRYRLALALALLVPAAAGVELLREVWHSRVTPPRWVTLATLLALFGTNLLPRFTGPDLRGEGPLQTAWAHLSAGRNRQAVTVLTPVSERPAGAANADLWYTLAEARDNLEDREGALEALDRALELAPDHAHALQHKGAILGFLGRPREAIAPLERCVRLNPVHPLAWGDLAADYLDVEDFAAAARAAERSVALNPGRGHAYIYLGTARRRLGDLAASETALRRAVALLPTVPDGRDELAETLDAQGRRAEALQVAQATATAHPQRERTRDLVTRLQGGSPGARLGGAPGVGAGP